MHTFLAKYIVEGSVPEDFDVRIRATAYVGQFFRTKTKAEAQELAKNYAKELGRLVANMQGFKPDGLCNLVTLTEIIDAEKAKISTWPTVIERAKPHCDAPECVSNITVHAPCNCSECVTERYYKRYPNRYALESSPM